MAVPPFDANPVPTLSSEAVMRVAKALSAAGHAHAPVILNDSARTAQEAAQALALSAHFLRAHWLNSDLREAMRNRAIGSTRPTP